jgi:hypothetical protein
MLGIPNALFFFYTAALVEIYTLALAAIIVVLESQQKVEFIKKEHLDLLHKYALFLKYVWGRGCLYLVAGTISDGMIMIVDSLDSSISHYCHYNAADREFATYPRSTWKLFCWMRKFVLSIFWRGRNDAQRSGCCSASLEYIQYVMFVGAIYIVTGWTSAKKLASLKKEISEEQLDVAFNKLAVNGAINTDQFWDLVVDLGIAMKRPVRTS